LFRYEAGCISFRQFEVIAIKPFKIELILFDPFVQGRENRFDIIDRKRTFQLINQADQNQVLLRVLFIRDRKE